MASEDVKAPTEGYTEAEEGKLPDAPAGAEGEDGMDEDGEAPDMAGLEAMMGGMGGGDGGAGGMDMSALMSMLGKGGGKGGGMGDLGGMMGGMGGMGGMGDMGGKGGKGGGKGGAKEDEEEHKAEKWAWSQKGEEVHVRIALDPVATSKKDVEVKFKSTSMVVKVRGETIIDGSLGGKVEADDCTWCFSPAKDELQLMLTKVEGKSESWGDLLG